MGGFKLIAELWDLFFNSFGDAVDFEFTVSYESLVTFKEYVRTALYFFPWDTAKVIFTLSLGAAAIRLIFALIRVFFALFTMIFTIAK